jgi:hypothetical protein
MICEKCGTTLADGVQFCHNCGAPCSPAAPATALDTVPVAAPVAAPTSEKKYKKNAMKPSVKKAIIAVIAAVAVIVVGIFVLVPVIKSIGGNDDASHIFYIQDGELYVSESDSKNPVQLSRNLIAEEDVDEEDAMYTYTRLYRFTKYSEKTNVVVFPDKIVDDDGISLYSLKLDSKANKTEPTKIAGDVDGESAIYFNDDESRLFYKNEEDSLYSYDFNEKAKIANDVSSFYVVPEKDTIVYMTYDNELYSMKISTSESTKIAADVSVQGITDTTIVYTTESTINVLLNGTDNLKIADFDSENEGVNVQDVDSDGKVLYYIYRDSDDDDDEGTPFSNFIEDDLYESDSKIVEPDRYDEKYWKETEEGFFGAYVTEYTDEYYTLKEQYEQKSARDSFRDRISDLKITKTMYSVYYFDSKNTTCITEQAANVNGIVYKIYDFDAVGKIKMSELATLNLEDGSTYSEPQDYSDISASDFRGYIYDRMNDTAVKYIFNNGKSIKVEGEFGDLSGLSGLEKDSNSTAAYFMYDETLYKANINNVDTCTPEALYSDVDRFILSESGDIFSFRNGDETSFDLYVNDKKIDSDVFIPLSFNSTDDFAYITDYTERDGNIEMPTFTVKYYNGKESSVIASDVSSAVAFGEKDVFYVCDSSTSTGSGTLKHYTGKKDTPVFAEDVYLVWQ